MDQHTPRERLSSELLRQINARRQEFERAWIDGKSPSLEEKLDGFSLAARPHLLRALLAIELEHRRAPGGGPLEEKHLIDAYPKLAKDLRVAYEELQSLQTRRPNADELTAPLPIAPPPLMHSTPPPSIHSATPTAPIKPASPPSPQPATPAPSASPAAPSPVDSRAMETLAAPSSMQPPSTPSSSQPPGQAPSKSSSQPPSGDARYETQAGGLHIRCPHCSNAVELLASTPYDSISCGSCGSAFSLVDKPEMASGAPTTMKTIDRFELLTNLGSGAFGTVWKARDPELDRVVALKVPRGGRLSPTEVEFFFREARAAAQLRHANIVPVHEVGRDGNTLFIVSDFVLGITLTDWLKGRRPTPLEIAQLSATIADGLHHAHQHGVVHRDLKPANILIDESNQPHIMDFGLAKREIGEVTMTVDGQILGTPAYMSPEQAGGEGHWTDRRSDIYSLGVIAFEMLTGELPFRGNYQMQIQQRLKDDAPDPRKLNKNISRDLATICTKCLDRDPARRYATSADVSAEFHRFMNGEPILARPLSGPARLARWARRKPLAATIAAMTIFLAIAGPTTALVIERQRSRLSELNSEKDNLITQLNNDNAQDAAKITELSDKLDLLEGRGSPWKNWPIIQDVRQVELLRNLHTFVTASAAKQPQNSPSGDENSVRGELGLAILADALVRADEAIEHYDQARVGLEALVEKNPERADLARTLAQCYTDLARLLEPKNRAASDEYLAKARGINRRLASEHAKNSSYQIAWLNSEVDSAAMAGLSLEAGMAHLKQANTILKSLPTKWPTKPDEIYLLACQLAGRDPLLPPASTKAAQ